MPAPIHDPVHRARYAFEPDGENLWVDTWLEPGGGLPPHLHPRQEEHWSVLEGEVRFQLGDDKRVIGPDDGEIVVKPGHEARARDVTDARGPPALPRRAGARPPGVPRPTAPRRPARASSCAAASRAACAARAGRPAS